MVPGDSWAHTTGTVEVKVCTVTKVERGKVSWAELREIAMLPPVKGHREYPKQKSRMSRNVRLDCEPNSVQCIG